MSYSIFRFAKVVSSAVMPTRADEGAAGYDLSACEEKIIPAGSWDKVDTGIAVEIPRYDCYARVAPRSGLAYKKGISVGAGVIDSSYRGTIQVILFNHGKEDFVVNPNDRIAQMIFERIYTPVLAEVSYEELTYTERGIGGFGSTGK